MNKIIILIVLFLQIFTVKAYASDQAEVYLSEDNAKIFTAIITNLTRETIDVKVIRKIQGDISEREILTLPHFEYDSRKNTKPEVVMKDNVAITTQTDNSKNIGQLFFASWIYVPLGILVSVGLLFVIKSKMKG